MTRPTFDAIHDNHDFRRAANMTENWDVNTCATCRHRKDTGVTDVCLRAPYPNHVTGEMIYANCGGQRDSTWGGACGPKGQFWEAKP